MVSKKIIKIPEFCRLMFEKGISRPTDIKIEFETRYPNRKRYSLDAYVKALKRQGLTKDVRDAKATEIGRKIEGKHILDYKEVIDYETQSKASHIQVAQVERIKKSITLVWDLMGRTDPHGWDFTSLINAIATKHPYTVNAAGQYSFEHMGAVRLLLSAVNTLFPNILKKGWYTGFCRPAGELKDFVTFAEFELFCQSLRDTTELSLEGWRALFKTQVNIGCREGKLGFNGILGFQWQDIDFALKRCSLHEKGGRGKAGRVWQNLPLDMFPWLGGFDDLCAYHLKKFGYAPSNDAHESGRVFSIGYEQYLEQFHATRKACNGRISGEKETFVPHIFRKTHAQWLVKLWVPLQDICGQFPDGHFGVGWDNPAILLKYYVTLESEACEKAELQAKERMIKLGLISGEIKKDSKDQLIEQLMKQVSDLTALLTNGEKSKSGISQPTTPS